MKTIHKILDKNNYNILFSILELVLILSLHYLFKNHFKYLELTQLIDIYT